MGRNQKNLDFEKSYGPADYLNILIISCQHSRFRTYYTTIHKFNFSWKFEIPANTMASIQKTTFTLGQIEAASLRWAVFSLVYRRTHQAPSHCYWSPGFPSVLRDFCHQLWWLDYQAWCALTKQWVIHLFTQKTIYGYLLCVRHCTKNWGYITKWNRQAHGDYVLVWWKSNI